MAQMIGPYRVEQRLGVGGMGEVYQAYDDRLDRWVAIKRIRPDKQQAEDNRERFHREAKATAKLNHASIVHVYDIFTDGDSECIVMEYVEGKTLDKLIMDGGLEPLRVARLGHEIAAGLAEAHSKGILHRDLKVENIIVTPEGRAKILDFGLAKPLLRDELDTSLTGKGQLVGTSRAMSPEYVSGEEVDHRSDLFALGVLLYEAVTGHSPFKAHNTLATLKQVMLYEQTPAHQLRSDVPEDFSELIDRLLRKNPADRPQSAEEVALEFGRITGNLSSESLERPSSGSMLSTGSFAPQATATATALELFGRRRWLLTLAVLLLLGGGVGLGWTFFGAKRDVDRRIPFEAKDQIVLGDFANRTDEPVLDDSVELAFRVGLEQSRYARVMPHSQLRSVLQRMQRDPDTTIDVELGLEICRREGATALVTGSIVKIGEAYKVTGNIIEPQTGSSTFTTDATATDRSRIISALEEVTQRIRNNLGESLAAIEETRPLEKVTTRNLEALNAYSLAVDKYSAGDYETAAHLYQQAIRLDPEFAMAHAKLGVYFLDFDPAPAVEHFVRAAELSDRLTESEKLYVQGWLARARGTPEEEFQIWSLLSNLYPDEYYGHVNLGMSYWLFQYQFDKAEAAFEEARRVAAPENLPQLYNRLAVCQLALGKTEEALATLQGAKELDPWENMVDVYVALERYEDAHGVVEPKLVNRQRDFQWRARWRQAEIAADRGRFMDALAAAREARRLTAGRDSQVEHLISHLWILAILEPQEKPEELRTTFEKATELARSLWPTLASHLDAFSPRLLPLLGKLQARAGLVEPAAELHALITPLAEESGNLIWKSYARILQGEILAAQGRPREALTELKESLALSETFQTRESLAHVYEQLGETTAARGEYQWMAEHRGRAFAECVETNCHILGILDSTLALYHLGRLAELDGDGDAAIRFYRRFLDRWPGAEDAAAWRRASERIGALAPAQDPISSGR